MVSGKIALEASKQDEINIFLEGNRKVVDEKIVHQMVMDLLKKGKEVNEIESALKKTGFFDDVEVFRRPSQAVVVRGQISEPMAAITGKDISGVLLGNARIVSLSPEKFGTSIVKVVALGVSGQKLKEEAKAIVEFAAALKRGGFSHRVKEIEWRDKNIVIHLSENAPDIELVEKGRSIEFFAIALEALDKYPVLKSNYERVKCCMDSIMIGEKKGGNEGQLHIIP